MRAVQILFRSFKELRKDSRVLRTGRTLREAAGDSHVIIFGADHESTSFDGLHVHVIGQPRWYPYHWVLFFADAQTLSSFAKLLLKILAVLFWVPVHGYWKRQVAARLDELAPDLIWANDMDTLPFAVAYKRRNPTVRLWYDSHELWSGSHRFRGRLGFPRSRWAARIEGRALRQVDRTITVNQPIADRLDEMYRPPGPVSVIYNIPERSSCELQAPVEPSLRERFELPDEARLVIVVGRLAVGRGIPFLVDAAKSLDEGDVLLFMGDGESALIEQIRHADRCLYHESVPPGDLLNVIAQADVGLCPIEPICESYRLALPNKFWECLHAGLPVVCSDLPVMRGFVEEHELGELFVPGDRDSLLSALQRIEPKSSYAQRIGRFVSEFDGPGEQARLLGWVRSALAEDVGDVPLGPALAEVDQ